MKLYKLYFSPTGGTKKAVNALCTAWSSTETEVEVDLSLPSEDFSQYVFTPDDLCVIAVPAFSGRVPTPALTRLSQMNGNGARAILLAVYGNRAIDDTLAELADALKKNGFHCIAAAAAIAEHSIARQVAPGRPDQRDLKELAGFSLQIRRRLEKGPVSEVTVPGSIPKRPLINLPFKPKANFSCVKCGLCAKLCPVSAIPQNAPNKTERKKCFTCMRCVAICPRRARRLSTLAMFGASLMLKKTAAQPRENQLFL